MRIYLDTCCLQRPLDDQRHPRIRVETEILFAVLAVVQANEISLLGSEALHYEINRIPDEIRREEAFSILSLASEHLIVTDAVEDLAISFEGKGLQAIDVLHLALASIAQADFFCTSDDRLLRRAKIIQDLGCKVTDLLNLIAEITK